MQQFRPGRPDAALEEFCRREFPRLVGAVALYCGDPHAAEELAQDALVRACERWPDVRAMRAPGAWVHRVAMNLAKSRLRRLGAEVRAYVRHGPQEEVARDADLEQALAIRQAVGRLPWNQRVVLVARFYLGWTVSETAEMLGVSCNSVSARTSRAVKRLPQLLGSDALSTQTLKDRSTFRGERT